MVLVAAVVKVIMCCDNGCSVVVAVGMADFKVLKFGGCC